MMCLFHEKILILGIAFFGTPGTATQEVKHFHKAEFLDKISIENNGILYCKNRLLETMEFTSVSGMDMVNLDPLGVNTKCPILDRHSPLAYAFAQYIHHDVSSHSGMETCNRLALERFYITLIFFYKKVIFWLQPQNFLINP